MNTACPNYNNIADYIYSEIRILIEASELLEKVYKETSYMKLTKGTNISEQTSKEIINYFNKLNQ